MFVVSIKLLSLSRNQFLQFIWPTGPKKLNANEFDSTFDAVFIEIELFWSYELPAEGPNLLIYIFTFITEFKIFIYLKQTNHQCAKTTDIHLNHKILTKYWLHYSY